MDGNEVRGVVLAGGASTRFGDEDKALATLDGRPLLAHVVSPVDRATDGRPILAVANEERSRRYRAALAGTPDGTGRPAAIETVTDVPDFSGPLAGLYAAVEASEAPWLFGCACDMPLVTPESIGALRDVAVDSAGAVDAVVPVVDGHDQPLHAVYRRTALVEVRESLAPGDALVALLDTLDAVERLPADEAVADIARATTNVNTRADLAALAGADDS